MHLSRISILSFLIFSSTLSLAQLQPAGIRLKQTKTFDSQSIAGSNQRQAQCGPDTAYYGYAKASTLQGLNINNATSADKAGQWFDAPQQMMLYGFTFYAWLSQGTADSVTLTCRIVLAGQDSLPTGPVVATTTVKVDSTFRGGNLNAIEKRAIFTNPVLIDYPFVIVIETPSPLNVALVSSDWDSADGGGEWLGMASIPGSGWLHGYNVNVGAVPFDADFVFNPIITYDINAGFTADNSCVLTGGDVTFTNTTNNPILQSRFYNQYVFSGTPQAVYAWDYDDGSPVDLLVDTTHSFAAGLDYNVTLRANMRGWSAICQDIYTDVINPSTTGGFTFDANVLSVDFTNTSAGYLNCLWDFGDGDTSSALNPTHLYGSEGDYNVKLIAFGECSNDTVQTLINVCNPLSSLFTFTTTGLTADFSVSSITGSASFSWDYGDGDTGSGISASHTYDSTGAYNVCLIATNSCNADTTCQQVAVVSTGIFTLEDETWDMFPNPTRGELVLFFRNRDTDLEEILLVDTKGAVAHTWRPTINEARRVVLSIPGIPAGSYFLITKYAENRQSAKQVILR